MMNKKKYDKMVNLISSILLMLIIIILSVYIFHEPISFIHYIILWFIIIGNNKRN